MYYYLNNSGTMIKDFQSFKGKEIYAIGFDDRNDDTQNECNIIVEK